MKFLSSNTKQDNILGKFIYAYEKLRGGGEVPKNNKSSLIQKPETIHLSEKTVAAKEKAKANVEKEKANATANAENYINNALSKLNIPKKTHPTSKKTVVPQKPTFFNVFKGLLHPTNSDPISQTLSNTEEDAKNLFGRVNLDNNYLT